MLRSPKKSKMHFIFLIPWWIHVYKSIIHAHWGRAQGAKSLWIIHAESAEALHSLIRAQNLSPKQRKRSAAHSKVHRAAAVIKRSIKRAPEGPARTRSLSICLAKKWGGPASEKFFAKFVTVTGRAPFVIFRSRVWWSIFHLFGVCSRRRTCTYTHTQVSPKVLGTWAGCRL